MIFSTKIFIINTDKFVSLLNPFIYKMISSLKLMPVNYKLVVDDTTIFSNKNISSGNIFSNIFFFCLEMYLHFLFFILQKYGIWYLKH